MNALPFICQTDRVVQKVSNVKTADWQYQTNKKLSQIYAFPQGWKSLLNTVIYTLNNNLAQYKLFQIHYLLSLMLSSFLTCVLKFIN